MTLCDLEHVHVCTVAGVMVMAPLGSGGNSMGPVPVSTTCFNCRRQVVTNVSYQAGCLTWLIVCLICCVASVIQRYHIPKNKLPQY